MELETNTLLHLCVWNNAETSAIHVLTILNFFGAKASSINSEFSPGCPLTFHRKYNEIAIGEIQ